MKNIIFLKLFYCFLILFVNSISNKLLADWPQFRGPTGDGRVNVISHPKKWSPKENLPKTKASQLNSKGDPIIISIKKNGELYIQEREIDTLKLLPRLKAISSGNKNLRILNSKKNSVCGNQLKTNLIC